MGGRHFDNRVQLEVLNPHVNHSLELENCHSPRPVDRMQPTEETITV